MAFHRNLERSGTLERQIGHRNELIGISGGNEIDGRFAASWLSFTAMILLKFG